PLLNLVDDINEKDNFGSSAITWTLQSNLDIPDELRFESIKTLVSLGADVSDIKNIVNNIDEDEQSDESSLISFVRSL
ncbi:MAG: hypothetical protein HWD90_09110, partial [Campylobacteraceae bacterium]|nr:hypothetical protein [Campylobacteraceae bacterium]